MRHIKLFFDHYTRGHLHKVRSNYSVLPWLVIAKSERKPLLSMDLANRMTRRFSVGAGPQVVLMVRTRGEALGVTRPQLGPRVSSRSCLGPKKAGLPCRGVLVEVSHSGERREVSFVGLASAKERFLRGRGGDSEEAPSATLSHQDDGFGVRRGRSSMGCRGASVSSTLADLSGRRQTVPAFRHMQSFCDRSCRACQAGGEGRMLILPASRSRAQAWQSPSSAASSSSNR